MLSALSLRLARERGRLGRLRPPAAAGGIDMRSPRGSAIARVLWAGGLSLLFWLSIVLVLALTFG
jgi:hypothetical protein